MILLPYIRNKLNFKQTIQIKFSVIFPLVINYSSIFDILTRARHMREKQYLSQKSGENHLLTERSRVEKSGKQKWGKIRQ